MTACEERQGIMSTKQVIVPVVRRCDFGGHLVMVNYLPYLAKNTSLFPTIARRKDILDKFCVLWRVEATGSS